MRTTAVLKKRKLCCSASACLCIALGAWMPDSWRQGVTTATAVPRVPQVPRVPRVPRWSVREFSFTTGRDYDNPYTQVGMAATFRGPGGVTRTVRGFWDGGRTFRVRFAPTAEGRWTYSTLSSDAGLSGHSGALECVAPERGSHGFVRRDAEHPRSFVYDDGTRYLMLGTTYYEIVSNALAGGGYQTSIARCAAYGINKVRFRLNIKNCSNSSNPYACSSPYGEDHDHLNPAHLRAADAVVEEMLARGVVADLMPFDSKDSFYGSDAQDERYLRYVIARYGAYPNVIWCLTNEWQRAPIKPRSFWNRAGGIVRAEDPWAAQGANLRPLSIHPFGGGAQGKSFAFADQEWPVHIILQAGRDSPADPINATMVSNLGHGMPVVNDEYGYFGDNIRDWGKGCSPALNRNALWGIYVAGGYASAGDKFRYPDGRPYHSANWHDRTEYGDIQRLVEFFTGKGVAYWKMASHNDLARGRRVYVLAEPGRQYVIYAAAGGKLSLRLAPGAYAARRYDPRTGEDIALPDAAGGTASWALPQGEDWVVYLKAKAS